MIHNLRMIRSRLGSNGWVLAELFLVFIVMWFLCDSLGCLKYTFYRPLGYDIEHVYRLTMVSGGESRDSSLTAADKYLTILRKLEQEPTVEVASLSYWSLPMDGSNSYWSLMAQDSVWVDGRVVYATGGYMDVFRLPDDPQHPFAKMPAEQIALSQTAIDRFRERIPDFSLDTPVYNGDTTNLMPQAGRIGTFREYRYGSKASWFFTRLDENIIKREFSGQWGQIAFRVKPASDGADYRAKFLKEVAPRLDTDNLFIADVTPYTQQQAQFEILNGDTDKVNTQGIVVLFLLVNVFLGLIGTFWFRTRRRRSEIGLRMAMGSPRRLVFTMLIGEGLLLLTLAALPAMLVCFNIGIAELSIGRTELITTWPVEWSTTRFLLGSLGAWLLMALMVTIGIWFPARKAVRIEPAEALHEE